MLLAASDQAQSVWQNMVLIAYASVVAAIPMGDALLFSFTVKKPLAIGVARSVFVSSLGASLAMIVTFAVWMSLESIYPSLHLDHFFYQLVESRLKAQAFYRLVMIFLLIEMALMALTVLLGGFLAAITPFVGEQNQDKTKFSFLSLIIDMPLGLSTISFIQAIVWCIMKYVEYFRNPSSTLIVQDQQERISAMNNSTNNIAKANKRVTFKTLSEPSVTSSKRCSEVSRTSSTIPILGQSKGEAGGEEEQSQAISRMASASSTSTLVPHYPNSSPGNVSTSGSSTGASSSIPSSENHLMPPVISQPITSFTKPRSRYFCSAFKGGSSSIPPLGNPVIPQPSPAASIAPVSTSRFGSNTLNRYGWLRSQNSTQREDTSASRFRTNLAPNLNPSFSHIARNQPPSRENCMGAYQRVAFQSSSEEYRDNRSSIASNEFHSLENTSAEGSSSCSAERKNYLRRKPVPAETIIDVQSEGGSLYERQNYMGEDSVESDGTSDEWAETKSEVTEEKHERRSPFRLF